MTPTLDDDDTAMWRRWAARHDISNVPEQIDEVVKRTGRWMAASPELERMFKREAERGHVFLTDHHWGRAGEEGLSCPAVEERDALLCQGALAEAVAMRKRLDDAPGPPDGTTPEDHLPMAGDEEPDAWDDEAEEWNDVAVGAAIEGNHELVKRLAAAGMTTARILDIDPGADLGDRPRAEITVTRDAVQSYEALLWDDTRKWWTSWEDALRLATEHLSAAAGEALERALTSKPETATDGVRQLLRPEGGLRRQSEDGLVPLIVPEPEARPWPEARYLRETARRAVESRPAMMSLRPAELRREWLDRDGSNEPQQILQRMAAGIDWDSRYSVRKVFMALQPEERDEAIVGGPPALSIHGDRTDGVVRLRLESGAWEKHWLKAPEEAVAPSTALILAGQTNQQLDHEPLQRAVDRLLWSEDTEEIDRIAAALAAKPDTLLKPAAKDARGAADAEAPPRIEFGRASTRETVRLYEQALGGSRADGGR